MSTQKSPQADALIGELHRQTGGRLTVFLGAAPGVGKTYAMLARARELHRLDQDVVIGIVETHGRSETAAMAEGLLHFPRQRVAHRGRTLEEMDLDGLLARKPASLSGGERQRVALARALVCAPKLLLLDEPLSALDAARRAEILPSLEMVRREAGIPILYVTHAIEEVARLADHLVLLDQGKVTASGPALSVLNQSDLPLALREDAGVVLDAQVLAREAHGLVSLHTPAGTLHAHGDAHPTGCCLRVRIQARDVSLALRRHDDSSLLNVLPVTLVAFAALPGGQVQVRLDAAGCPLLARISHRSLERLALHPGMQAWAQIKAVALLV